MKREELILEIAKASVQKNGADANPAAVKIHVDGIVALADELLKRMEKKDK